MGKEIKNKRGQVTLFVIVGAVILTGILTLVVLMNQGGESVAPSDLGPRAFIVGCVRDAVDESLDLMLKNGGEILVSQGIMYKGEEWNYLCYQADYYQGCYNLHPMLELQIEKEIEEDISENVEACFNAVREDFEDRGYDVSAGATTYTVDLLPGYVAVDLKKEMEIDGVEGIQVFEDFGLETISPIYDLVRVTRDIVNSESEFCNFEYGGYMFLYPEYDIKQIGYQDSRLYRVIDRRSGGELKFAVRSCALPLGL